MLTWFTSDEAMLQAILVGASGYVVKDIGVWNWLRRSKMSVPVNRFSMIDPRLL